MRSADSKIMYRLQVSPRPLTVEEIQLNESYAAGTIRKSLMRLYRQGLLWRGRGRKWGWGGPSCGWWWIKTRAEQEGLGQIYERTN